MKNKKMQLLDCTLRDGSYITESKFGEPAMKGIITKMQEAHVDVIEVGWLKDKEYTEGTTFFHVPSDAEKYIVNKDPDVEYVAMIDWDRYNLDALPPYDGKSIDAIRLVFPVGHFKEGIALGQKIKDKGYRLYVQAANTLGYSDKQLLELIDEVNKTEPVAISVVDTFGAMYPDDLRHIVDIFERNLDKKIRLGFHSHNNQQLSFALCQEFVNILKDSERGVMLDGSLCGMGRGAGNATTELVASFLNKKYNAGYDMNAILDAIDTYMEYFKEHFSWGYSTPYFVAGMYQCHVNNIAYLQKNHRANSKDMRNIISSLSQDERRAYDYDLLEKRYLENQDRKIDDAEAVAKLKAEFKGKEVLLLAPGKSVLDQEEKISQYISSRDDIVTIGVNAIVGDYTYDYLLFVNSVRYHFAKEAYPEKFTGMKKILLSNIKTDAAEDETVINFNRIIKRGWEHFDNAVITALRMLDQLGVKRISIAGFDGFKQEYNESYADPSLPTLNTSNNWDTLNEEIRDMYHDFVKTRNTDSEIKFITESEFN